MENMISGFIYVGREALEMVFLTYLIMGSLPITIPIVLSAIAGLITGISGGYILGEILEPYEWATYGVLALLMLYLFFNSKNIQEHISRHVREARKGIGVFAGASAIFIIYFRESMEINTFLFMDTGDFTSKLIGAIIAIVVVVIATPIIMKRKIIQHNLFNITRYTFLLFGIWFAYEALEHADIL
jgi:drug/metabolite transporter (DMT)-like permease